MIGTLSPIALAILVMLSCSTFSSSAMAKVTMTSQQEALSNLEKTLPPADSKERFFKLSQVAAAAYDAGDYDKAQAYANELLSDANQYQGNWNYGNAIFYGNLMLGRVALKRDNNTSAAESYLLAAGRTPGSPQLNSFGPNMILAQDLLKQGERDVVLDFIDEWGKFWKADNGRLSEWKNSIDQNETPNFAPNLSYF